MRPSPQRHTLAVLRTFLGLTQKEMASMLDCSVPTIQAIELGKLKLGDRLGHLISSLTGVDLIWLKEDDVNKPATDLAGAPYSKQMFESTQAYLRDPSIEGGGPSREMIRVQWQFLKVLNRLVVLFIRAYRGKKFCLLDYRVDAALKDLRKKTFEGKSLTDEEARRWDPPIHEEVAAIIGSKWGIGDDLQAVVKHFSDETTKIRNDLLERRKRRSSRVRKPAIKSAPPPVSKRSPTRKARVK